MSPRSRRADGLALAALALLCAPALWPLLAVPAWQSHDGLHHIFRIAAFADGLRGGVAYPRWADGLGFGYGFPVTHYYAPLAYYLVAALNLGGVPVLDGIKLAYALGIVVSAFGMYALARRALNPAASLLAAAAYAYYPYHLADIYMRGTLTEFMALALLPLLAWSAERIAGAPRLAGRVALFAVLTAALILTHNLTAFLALPALALYLALRFWPMVRLAPLRASGGWLAGVALGFALAAFYWLPALAETAWIRAGQVSGGVDEIASLLMPLAQFVSPALYQPYQPDAPAQLQHPLGLAVALASAAAVALCAARWGVLDDGLRRAVLTWGAVALVALFAMSELSAPVWSALRPLSLVQFPFRLHAVLGLALAWLIGAGAEALAAMQWPRPATLAAVAGVLVSLVVSPLGALSLSPQVLPGHKEPLDNAQINVAGMADYDYQTALWTRLYGGIWLFEYMPAWVTEGREEFFLPRSVVPTASARVPAGATVSMSGYAPESRLLRVNTPAPFRLSFHTFYFPPWQARIDGVTAPLYPAGTLALAGVDVPPGEHEIALSYGETAFGAAGLGLLAFALLALWGLAFVADRRAGIMLAAALAACALGIWAATAAAQSASAVQPADATFDGQISLIGYRTDRAAYHAGDTADVTLFWLARRAPAENFKVFVHLDGAGGRAGQADGQPGLNFSPTTRWQAGEIIADPVRLRIAPNARPGTYDLLAGMYRTGPVQNLPVESPAATPDNRARLGTLEIVPR